MVAFNRFIITLLIITGTHQLMLNAQKLPLSIGFSNPYTLSYDLKTAIKELDAQTRAGYDSMDLQTLAESISRMFHNLQVVQAEYNRASGAQLKAEFREAIKELQLRLIYAQSRYDNLARMITPPARVVEPKPIEYAPVEVRTGRQPMAIANQDSRNPFSTYDSMSASQLEQEIATLELKINGSQLAFKRDGTKENREILSAWRRELEYVENLLRSKRR